MTELKKTEWKKKWGAQFKTSVFTMVPDTGSVAKNKTQSGSLFEGCRDVARAPEHNHLTHLFKETET